MIDWRSEILTLIEELNGSDYSSCRYIVNPISLRLQTILSECSDESIPQKQYDELYGTVEMIAQNALIEYNAWHPSNAKKGTMSQSVCKIVCDSIEFICPGVGDLAEDLRKK